MITETLNAFITSLAIGLLIGLERERRPGAKAGLRTFALTALFGTLSALIAQATASGWILAVGLLLCGAMMMLANALAPLDDGDPGTTSVVALMLAYGLGAAVWLGYGQLAVMLAIGITALLYFKPQLQGFTRRLEAKDLISILQFAVLSFVILPILPDQDYGPYQAFNPHQIWRMVVLVAGLSLAGYAALRLVGARHGAALIGFFGGLVSSTATTLVYARHSRADPAVTATAATAILIANLMVQLRLGLIGMVLAPSLILPLSLIMGSGLLLGLIAILFGLRGMTSSSESPLPEVTNPTELKTALSFGALYAFVLLLAAGLEDLAGSKGLYLVSLISGLTDVDAITLSTLHLYALTKLAAQPAVTAIVLAALANLVFKTGLVLSVGGPALARRVLPGLAAIGGGLGLGLYFLSDFLP